MVTVTPASDFGRLAGSGATIVTVVRFWPKIVTREPGEIPALCWYEAAFTTVRSIRLSAQANTTKKLLSTRSFFINSSPNEAEFDFRQVDCNPGAGKQR